MIENYKSLRVLVNTPIYGGSYTTAQYVFNALNQLNICSKMTDNSVAEPLLKTLINKQITNQNTEILASILSNILWHEICSFKPHIVFFVAQSPFTDRLIAELKKLGIITIYWFVEDFRRFTYWKAIQNNFDYFYFIQKRTDGVSPLMWRSEIAATVDGGTPSVRTNGVSPFNQLIPTAACKQTHIPLKLTPEEKNFYGSDISFMGAAYINRVNFFKYFNKNNFKLWGTGWTETELKNYNIPLKNQRITPEQSNKIYQSSKININLHSSNTDGFDNIGDFVNPRTFEIAACGGFQLVDDRPALRELFEADKEIVYFSSVNEAIDKANFYLKNDDLRDKIAKAAQQKVLKYHTYDKRVDLMLQNAMENSPSILETIKSETDVVHNFLKIANDKELEKLIYSIQPALRTSYNAVMNKLKNINNTLKKQEALALLLETFLQK